MTQPMGEEPIVIHAPMTGDDELLRTFPRPQPARTDIVGPLTVSERPAAAVSVAPTERVLGLDALRGILLLAMNFTFTIPPWGPFPKWMYHTQVPPSPTREYVAVAGLTWQDMLFSMFVFTMAAAIPIAMSGRLAKGKPYPDILWQSVRRGFLLLVFAFVIGHVNPYWTNDYTKRGNVLAIAGLLVSFAVFVQPPRSWSPRAVRVLRRAGWLGVAAVLFAIPLLYGQQFSAERRDHIMSALAFCTVAGTAAWLFTRGNLTARLAIFAALVVGRTLAPAWEPFGFIWTTNPAPWFYAPWYLDLLLIVIPGTIAGDLILRWTRANSEARSGSPPWSPRRAAALAVIGFSFMPVLNVGLYQRRYPEETLIAVVAMAALLLWIARKPGTQRDRVLSRLYAWAAVWLVLGMLVEPLEGGIKKDPQTLGFLLVMAGAATVALGSLLITLDCFKAGGRRLAPIALIGQNALFAYVLYMLGFEHLLWLTGIGDSFTSTVATATLRSVTFTVLVGIVVWLATKHRLVWKA